MLPTPATSRSKNRTYFPSLPPNPSYAPSPSQLLQHLRARTRLTNLAVSIIISLLIFSLLLNLATFYSPYPPSRRKGFRRLGGWEDNATPGQIDSLIPLSIETTIERDTRYGELNHLVMVPGHAIWVGNDVNRIERDEDWILESMQRGGSVRTFVQHIRVGVEELSRDSTALLVFSGGATRPPPSPPFSEGLSYLSLAIALNLLPPSPSPPHDDSTSPLPIYHRATIDEYALDSYENLLFSFARFKEVTGRWPEKVTVVGYGMKRRRFELLHRAAIGFPLENFNYIGIDDEGDTTEHYAGELKYGFTPFLSSPSGCHPPLSTKRLLRNPYFRYHPYHTSCPEISDLLEWCPPLVAVPPSEEAPGVVYEGYLPWRGLEENVRWGRERG